MKIQVRLLLIFFVIGYITGISVVPFWDSMLSIFIDFFNWGLTNSQTATVFTGICAIIAAIIAFCSVFLVLITNNIFDRRRKKKIWKGQCSSICHHILMVTTNLKIKFDICNSKRDVRLLSKIFMFGDSSKSSDMRLSTSYSMFNFSKEDMDNMDDNQISALNDYEFKSILLSKVLQQIIDKLAFLDGLQKSGKTVSETDYLIGEDFHTSLSEAVRAVDKAGESLCAALDEKLKAELYKA